MKYAFGLSLSQVQWRGQAAESRAGGQEPLGAVWLSAIPGELRAAAAVG